MLDVFLDPPWSANTMKAQHACLRSDIIKSATDCKHALWSEILCPGVNAKSHAVRSGHGLPPQRCLHAALHMPVQQLGDFKNLNVKDKILTDSLSCLKRSLPFPSVWTLTFKCFSFFFKDKENALLIMVHLVWVTFCIILDSAYSKHIKRTSDRRVGSIWYSLPGAPLHLSSLYVPSSTKTVGFWFDFNCFHFTPNKMFSWDWIHSKWISLLFFKWITETMKLTHLPSCCWQTAEIATCFRLLMETQVQSIRGRVKSEAVCRMLCMWG